MNLFLCLTPLQILITKKLIELKKEQSEVLILTYNVNEKYEYYMKVIEKSQYVNRVSIIKIEDNNIFTKMMTLQNIVKWSRDKKYKTAYLASIDNFFMHCVLHYSEIVEVYTFDDGTANILESSFYFIDKSSRFSRIIKKLLGIQWTLDCIKKQTKKHYTIYHDIKNIVTNTEYIDVFSYGNLVLDNNTKKKVSIYLGQPFDNKMVSMNVYKKLKHIDGDVKYYIHPREKKDFLLLNGLGEDDIIQSDLIIEDYVSELLTLNYTVALFSVSSSAAFNLYNTRGVAVCFVIDDTIEEVEGLYNLIKEKSLKTISLGKYNDKI